MFSSLSSPIFAGLLVLVILSPKIAQLRIGTPLRWMLIAMSLIGAFVYVRVLDPTMGGRTQLWHDYLDLWRSSPLWGVGDSGIREYVLSGGQFSEVAHVHGHSIFIDALARNGLMLIIPVLLLLVLCLCLGLAASRKSGPQSLALVVFAICTGIAETTLSWSYLNILTLPLISAIILGASVTSMKTRGALDSSNIRRDA
jgi:O-antigen ligase